MRRVWAVLYVLFSSCLRSGNTCGKSEGDWPRFKWNSKPFLLPFVFSCKIKVTFLFISYPYIWSKKYFYFLESSAASFTLVLKFCFQNAGICKPCSFYSKAPTGCVYFIVQTLPFSGPVSDSDSSRQTFLPASVRSSILAQRGSSGPPT